MSSSRPRRSFSSIACLIGAFFAAVLALADALGPPNRWYVGLLSVPITLAAVFAAAILAQERRWALMLLACVVGLFELAQRRDLGLHANVLAVLNVLAAGLLLWCARVTRDVYRD